MTITPAPRPIGLETFKTLGWNIQTGMVQRHGDSDADPTIFLAAETYGGGEAVMAVTLNSGFETRCGYVIVPVESLRPDLVPFVRRKTKSGFEGIAGDIPVGAHGGVTFATTVDGKDIPSMGYDGLVAVIGFDCAHRGDGSDIETAGLFNLRYTELARRQKEEHPELPPLEFVGHVWTTDEVMAECRHLAEQVVVPREG